MSYTAQVEMEKHTLLTKEYRYAFTKQIAVLNKGDNVFSIARGADLAKIAPDMQDAIVTITLARTMTPADAADLLQFVVDRLRDEPALADDVSWNDLVAKYRESLLAEAKARADCPDFSDL